MSLQDALLPTDDPLERSASFGSALTLSVFLITGSALGSCVAVFTSFFPDTNHLTALSFIQIFGKSVWPCLFLVFLSASVYGRYLIPAVFCARGFCISAAQGFLLRNGSDRDIAAGCVFFPAVFSLFAFFLIGTQALESSRALLTRNEHSFEWISGRRIRLAFFLSFISAAAQKTVFTYYL